MLKRIGGSVGAVTASSGIVSADVDTEEICNTQTLCSFGTSSTFCCESIDTTGITSAEIIVDINGSVSSDVGKLAVFDAPGTKYCSGVDSSPDVTKTVDSSYTSAYLSSTSDRVLVRLRLSEREYGGELKADLCADR